LEPNLGGLALRDISRDIYHRVNLSLNALPFLRVWLAVALAGSVVGCILLLIQRLAG
jgi:hypothetical protein